MRGESGAALTRPAAFAARHPLRQCGRGVQYTRAFGGKAWTSFDSVKQVHRAVADPHAAVVVEPDSVCLSQFWSSRSG